MAVLRMTRTEYQQKYGVPPPVQATPQAPIPQQTQPQSSKGIGQKFLDAGTGVANFFGAKGISEQFGSDIARARAPESEKGFVEYPKMKEGVGSAIQTGANLLPVAGKGASLLGKVAAGAGTGYAFDVGSNLQQNKVNPFSPSVGTAVGGGVPIAGAVLKPATKIVGRLLKGLGSGLSGVSTDTINKIVDNPKAAQMATDKLNKSGNAKFLEENARQIMNGVSTVRQQARKTFGEGLESLAETDIKPDVFRGQTQQFLDKYGYKITDKGRKIANAEFTDPKNVSKANELINKLNTVKLDGKSIRKLADDIESSAYKIATSDERLSFNAFIKDLSASLKGAVSNSTGKLDDINKTFSSDMQLTEAVEDIFGKVKFKNLPEVVKATKKLEGMFAQKGIAPEVIDDFLKRIGVIPEDFKTGEAVRQISNKSSGANTKGLSVGEIVQQATSAVVTPQMVRDVAIKIGVAEKTLLPELRKLSPSIRNIIMNALSQNPR